MDSQVLESIEEHFSRVTFDGDEEPEVRKISVEENKSKIEDSDIPWRYELPNRSQNSGQFQSSGWRFIQHMQKPKTAYTAGIPMLGSFPRFTELPTELRRKIFKHALPSSPESSYAVIQVVLYISESPKGISSFFYGTEYQEFLNPPQFHHVHHQRSDLALLETSRESREVFLETFKNELPVGREGGKLRFEDDTIICCNNLVYQGCREGNLSEAIQGNHQFAKCLGDIKRLMLCFGEVGDFRLNDSRSGFKYVLAGGLSRSLFLDLLVPFKSLQFLGLVHIESIVPLLRGGCNDLVGEITEMMVDRAKHAPEEDLPVLEVKLFLDHGVQEEFHHAPDECDYKDDSWRRSSNYGCDRLDCGKRPWFKWEEGEETESL